MTPQERFEILKDKYYYDEDEANEKVNFIEEMCTHVKGRLAGSSLLLDPWQKDEIIRPIFGLKYKKGGRRVINKVYIEIPRKNAKTTLCASIELILLFTDGEPGAEIYNCAGDDEQANLLFRITKSMIANNDDLSGNSHSFQSSITYGDSFIKKITSKSDTKHGLNSHGVVYDEFHVAPNSELYDVLKTSTGARRNPLFIAITTAGDNMESVCFEQHDIAVKILDGVIEDDNYWVVVYAAASDADIYSEQTWRSANPLYDSSPELRDYLARSVKEIKYQPTFESTFRRLHLNQWVGARETWMPDDKWMACASKFEPEPGDESYWGLDLGLVQDVSALVGIFPKEWGVGVKCFFYIPEETAHERTRRENINYDLWIKDGYVKTTPGSATDYGFIEVDIMDNLMINYNIRAIGYDRKYSSELVLRLEKQIGEGIMSPFGQGYVSMNAPIKQLEKMILNKQLRHSGNPVLRWMCSNVDMKLDVHENASFQKRHKTNRIDGMVALAMAVGEWMTAKPIRRSRYEDNPEFDVIKL